MKIRFEKINYHFTGEDKLPSTQQQIIEQAKFTYSPSRKAFEKQTRTIEDQGKSKQKQLKIKEKNKEKLLENMAIKLMMIQ